MEHCNSLIIFITHPQHYVVTNENYEKNKINIELMMCLQNFYAYFIYFQELLEKYFCM